MPLEREPDTARSFLMNQDNTGTGERYMKLTERQQALNEFWSFYKVEEHNAKGVDWQGRQVMSKPARDAITRQGYTPPGYEQASDVPKELRRPIAPLGIVRNIVSRFTGLLFSNRKQPRVTVPGDEDTEDYLSAVIKQGRMWSAAIQARNYGGGTGTACIGFRFVNGICMFEALDPRWVEPEFAGRGYSDPIKLTIQYTYSKEVMDDDTGRYKKVWYWYRRIIDTETDTVWVPVKCKDKEPNWEYIQHQTIRHNLGFVPYEWIQNRKEDDETDGEPDCAGCYDMISAIDLLLNEVFTGTWGNCDPTLVMVTDMQLGAIKKGSDNAIRLNQGSSSQYMELQGAGPRVGIEVIKELEDRVYRLAQCVPDSVLFQNNGEKTALEIERIFSSMLERADDLREQYGPALERLCQKVLAAIRFYTSIREAPDGRLVRGRVIVPPRVIQQPDGDVVEIPRSTGKGTICEVKWPPYFRPTMNDIETALRVATTAKDSDVMTKGTAINYYAPFLDIDPIKEIHALKRAEEQTDADEAAAAGTDGAGAEGDGAAPEEGADAGAGAPAEDGSTPPASGEGAGTPAPASNPATWGKALESGIVTLNEYRQNALGLGAIPDGDLTMVQYRAKYAQLFVANAAVTNPAVAAKAALPQAPTAPGKPGPGSTPSGEGQTSPSEGQPAPPPKRPSSAPEEPAEERESQPPPEPDQES